MSKAGWRARPDSNQLPPAVLAGALPKAPLARLPDFPGGQRLFHSQALVIFTLPGLLCRSFPTTPDL